MNVYSVILDIDNLPGPLKISKNCGGPGDSVHPPSPWQKMVFMYEIGKKAKIGESKL